MTVTTSSGLVGRNIDDVTCVFGVDRGFPTPPSPLTYTVRDQSGSIIATGTLGSGAVTSKRPSYRCTAEEKIHLQALPPFIEVEFATGQRVTGPGNVHLMVELS